MKNKGYVLASLLVLSTVLLILGMGAMYMTEMGLRSLSAEQRWHRMEKAANAGINEAVNRIVNGENCGININLNFNNALVEVRTVWAGNGCFIWSRADIGNSRVVKTAIIPIDLPLGAANFVKLDTVFNNPINTWSVRSCDTNCQVPALMTGNELNPLPRTQGCTGSDAGYLRSYIIPYVPNAFGPNENLTSRVFNGASNRNELFNILNQGFGVNFRPNGEPTYDPPNFKCRLHGYRYCEVSTLDNNKIKCGNSIVFNDDGTYADTRIIITWSSKDALYNIIDNTNEQTIAKCENISLPNADLYFYGEFQGGGIIQAKSINLEDRWEGSCDDFLGDCISTPAYGIVHNVTFVTDNFQVKNKGIGSPRLHNVNIFAEKLRAEINRGTIMDVGVLYAGGPNGFMILDIAQGHTLGTEENPVLIIVDYKMEIHQYHGEGQSQINGLIYITENARSFKFRNSSNDSNHNKYLNLSGMLVSNSRNENYIPPHFAHTIIFRRDILNTLATKYSFVRRPGCGGGNSIGVTLIQTKITTY